MAKEGTAPHPIVRSADSSVRAPTVIVLMGVAGSGKTTIGRQLAATLGWPFRDADEFHPATNVAKMAAGIPLSDEDRKPWLAQIRDYIDEKLDRHESAIVTCSALREAYRQVLTQGRPEVKLVYLAGDYDLILERLGQRTGHFMKPAMLQSQFSTLEVPHGALTVDIRQSPAAIVAAIRNALSL